LGPDVGSLVLVEPAYEGFGVLFRGQFVQVGGERRGEPSGRVLVVDSGRQVVQHRGAAQVGAGDDIIVLSVDFQPAGTDVDEIGVGRVLAQKTHVICGDARNLHRRTLWPARTFHGIRAG